MDIEERRGNQAEKPAKAILFSETPNQTKWFVRLSPATQKEAVTYRVTTYPNSGLIYIENSNGRAVPQGVATRVTSAVRAAIDSARMRDALAKADSADSQK